MSHYATICYADHADKRAKYAARTLPAIAEAFAEAINDPQQRRALLEWLQDNRITDAGTELAIVQAVHRAARAGRYVPHPPSIEHCDRIQPASHTLQAGGDCDQWAVVMLAALWLMGVRNLALVTFGNDLDPYQHVAVMAGGELLDPKGDQQGSDFNEWPRGFTRHEKHTVSLVAGGRP